MPAKYDQKFNPSDFRTELEEHDHDLGELPGWIFEGLLIYADRLSLNGEAPLAENASNFRMKLACNTAKFAGARVTKELTKGVTHVLIGEDRSRQRVLREQMSGYLFRLHVYLFLQSDAISALPVYRVS